MDVSWVPYIVSVQCIITAIFLAQLSRREKDRAKREEEREKREEARVKSEEFVVSGVFAVMTLGEAIAVSVKHLDEECNGEMKEALAHVKKTKHEHKGFLQNQALKNLQL